jgi:hypothetical protein
METYVHLCYLVESFAGVEIFQTKSKRAFYVQQICPENRAAYKIKWKNMVEQNRPQMTTKYGAGPVHAV